MRQAYLLWLWVEPGTLTPDERVPEVVDQTAMHAVANMLEAAREAADQHGATGHEWQTTHLATDLNRCPLAETDGIRQVRLTGTLLGVHLDERQFLKVINEDMTIRSAVTGIRSVGKGPGEA
jgi:hypothetical protein